MGCGETGIDGCIGRVPRLRAVAEEISAEGRDALGVRRQGPVAQAAATLRYVLVDLLELAGLGKGHAAAPRVTVAPAGLGRRAVVTARRRQLHTCTKAL